jgi:hypothetical protein
LSSGLCLPVPDLPCTQSNINGTCLSCANNYQLVNSTCQVILGNVCTSNCSTCPLNYYLSNSTCLACPTSNNCLQCDSFNPTHCLKCAKGYFFNGSSCIACSSNCQFCSGLNQCYLAAPGYYIARDSQNLRSGTVSKCKSTCATCKDEQHCTSCPANSSLTGV